MIVEMPVLWVQSKPHDIMSEVYRAMKALDFEWKIMNPYHVQVRRKNPGNAKYVKMSLQLYQVNYTSSVLNYVLLPSRGQKA